MKGISWIECVPCFCYLTILGSFFFIDATLARGDDVPTPDTEAPDRSLAAAADALKEGATLTFDVVDADGAIRQSGADPGFSGNTNFTGEDRVGVFYIIAPLSIGLTNDRQMVDGNDRFSDTAVIGGSRTRIVL